MFATGNTCVKLQSRITSSGATVAILFFFFFLLFTRGLGVHALAEFCEWAGHEGTLIFGRFRILVLLLVRVVGVKIGKCWQVKVLDGLCGAKSQGCVDRLLKDFHYQI